MLKSVSLLAFLVASAALTPARAHADTQTDIAAELEKARKLSSVQDYRGACKAYQRAHELAQGKSSPALIGLSNCFMQIKDEEKSLVAARQALAAAATPDERSWATTTLGQALLRQPNEASWTEAATLFKEQMASSGGTKGRSDLLGALLILHRDQEAADLLQSLRKQGMSEDEIHQKVLFGAASSGPQDPVDTRRVDDLTERLHRLDPDAPLRIGGKIPRPELLRQVNPQITDEARQHRGFSGTVILQSIIDTEGKVRVLRVLKEQPYGLTEAAVNAVKAWTFKPVIFDGKPVSVWYVLTVNFQVQ